MIKIKIAIPVYHRADKFKAAIESLSKTDIDGLDVKFFLGINGADIQLRQYIDQLKYLANFYVYEDEKGNIGKPKMINILAAISDFDFLVSYDSDMIAESPNWLKEFIRLYEKYSNQYKIGAIAANQSGMCSHVQTLLIETINKELSFFKNNWGVAGGVYFISKNCWRKVGGYKAFRTFAADDAFFVDDCRKQNITVPIAVNVSFIHPWDNEEEKKGYRDWKARACIDNLKPEEQKGFYK